MSQSLFSRSAGILMHISSLPGKYGIGDFGGSAYQFVDFLQASGMKLWQFLPLAPTGYGNSPYSAYSAFACNHYFISPDVLVKRGYLTETDTASTPLFSEETVEFDRVIAHKMTLLEMAYESFAEDKHEGDTKAFESFCTAQKSWLDDYALFMAIKGENNNDDWSKWSEGQRMKTASTMTAVKKKLASRINFHKFLQFEFNRQWLELKQYANSKGIKFVGDIPIFVAYDSADVWAKKEQFRLDDRGLPTVVAGVPPDYFSATGQLWGNPHYHWDVMKKSNFSWWGDRFTRMFELFDIVRIDHFRGFEAFWEIPFGEKTAINGTWVKAPGSALFASLRKKFGNVPIIAEDLGVITDEVTALRKESSFPGMKILQFGFESCNPQDAFLPHNYELDCVVYTGTHDNDTSLGWFRSVKRSSQEFTVQYLHANNEHELVWAMIESAFASVATMAIFPMQDVLTLGSEARLNTPGVAEGNWGWRLKPNVVAPIHLERLVKLSKKYNRYGNTTPKNNELETAAGSK
jgi:4-alpha-glucanotransferase